MPSPKYLFNDLDEAAALTKALDMVISTPTSMSILSASLGVTTWQMTFGADWQTLRTDHNPWVSSMRQYLRQWNQSWGEIIAAVAIDLQKTPGLS